MGSNESLRFYCSPIIQVLINHVNELHHAPPSSQNEEASLSYPTSQFPPYGPFLVLLMPLSTSLFHIPTPWKGESGRLQFSSFRFFPFSPYSFFLYLRRKQSRGGGTVSPSPTCANTQLATISFLITLSSLPSLSLSPSLITTTSVLPSKHTQA